APGSALLPRRVWCHTREVDGVVPPRSLLAGREAELGRLLELTEEAVAGHFVMVLLTGEPGVGKTSLVTETCARMAPSTDQLFGSCLPLTSLSLPFLPLRAALRTWQATHPDVGPVVARSDHERLPEAFDDWLEG